MCAGTTADSLWPSAKEMLLPYDGTARQLYVLDNESRHLKKVLDLIASQLKIVQVVALDGDGLLGSEDPVELDDAVKRKIAASTNTDTMHGICGLLLPKAPLYADFFIDGSNKSFDVELWFHADLLFPNDLEETVHQETFDKIVSLANAIRDDDTAQRCVLTPYEAGDPRKQMDDPQVIVW
jgi:hypothetical protein